MPRPSAIAASLLAAGLMLAVMTAAEAGCRVSGPATICGEGRDAIRIFRDTVSPDGTLAIGWRSAEGRVEGNEPPGTDAIDNLLVRLTDGAVLADLPAEDWELDAYHANRTDTQTTWSPDGRWLIYSFRSHYEVSTLAIFAFEGGALLDQREMLPTLDRMLRKETGRQAKARRLKLDPANLVLFFKPPGKISAKGEVSFNADAWIPKRGPNFGYSVQMTLALDKARIADPRPRVRAGAYRPAE